jgi:hypothetical protein
MFCQAAFNPAASASRYRRIARRAVLRDAIARRIRRSEAERAPGIAGFACGGELLHCLVVALEAVPQRSSVQIGVAPPSGLRARRLPAGLERLVTVDPADRLARAAVVGVEARRGEAVARLRGQVARAAVRGLRGERSLERERERREARDGGTQPTHLLLLERTAPRRRAGRESKAEKVWRSGNSAASSEVSTRLRWCERRLLGGAIQITKSSSRPNADGRRDTAADVIRSESGPSQCLANSSNGFIRARAILISWADSRTTVPLHAANRRVPM